MKPTCHQSYESGELKGSMLIQEVDRVALTRSRNITYFVPNNIAILLSISKKSLKAARYMYSKHLANGDFEFDLEKMQGSRRSTMNSASALICDYLEHVQSSIVFGYTAIEAFANLSIPGECIYKPEKNNKGISEIYDKKAIERWLPLRTKIEDILVEVYSSEKIQGHRWWDWFKNLEDYRNEIIHQKSISHSEFYKVYFKKNIFNICESPSDVIAFFYNSHAKENKTNPIWPWIEGVDTMPISRSYDSSKFEVVGNLYEGIKKGV